MKGDPFDLADQFKISRGEQPIVVAAPHHGNRPNRNSDLMTGPIARALAGRLGASLVIASNLRRWVDVNKDPAGIPLLFRNLAIHYQDLLFQRMPGLIIEMHGHVSGKYPVEISSGFDLQPSLPGDVVFIKKLDKLKRSLPGQLLQKLGREMQVGVFPIDQDVRMTAARTFTFQKVHRARARLGMELYSLHIELAASLRTSQQIKDESYLEALVEALGRAIQDAFMPVREPKRTLPIDLGSREELAGSNLSLKVVQTGNGVFDETRIFLHPGDFARLGILDGDRLNISSQAYSLLVPVASSSLVRSRQVALTTRLQNRLEVKVGDRITINANHRQVGQNEKTGMKYFLLEETRVSEGSKAWINPGCLNELSSHASNQFWLKTPGRTPHQVTLLADEFLPDQVIVLSPTLKDHLALTLGETVLIEEK